MISKYCKKIDRSCSVCTLLAGGDNHHFLRIKKIIYHKVTQVKNVIKHQAWIHFSDSEQITKPKNKQQKYNDCKLNIYQNYKAYRSWLTEMYTD